jgi:hypothetical protein
MVADWATVGLRRLEAHLAAHAAFCDFLRARAAAGDDDAGPCPPPPDR